MGSTNKTQYLELPQWIGTDKPTFLGDFNDAFLKIDNGYNTINGTATTAGAQAGQAVEDATEALNKAESIESIANTANTNANQALQAANNSQTSVNQLTTRVSTLEEKINFNWTIAELTSPFTNSSVHKVYFLQNLNLMTIIFHWSGSNTSFNNVALGTLPTAMRPSAIRSIQSVLNYSNASQTFGTGDISIDTDGVIRTQIGAGLNQCTEVDVNITLCTVEWY